MKTCTKCGESKPLDEFGRQKGRKDGKASWCLKCAREYSREWKKANRLRRNQYMREWKKANPDKESKNRVKTLYGITAERYDQMVAEQDNKCAICHTNDPGGNGNWSVDHDHSCCEGQRSCGSCVRGLLCRKCNLALGMLNDDVERLTSAINYLMEAS